MSSFESSLLKQLSSMKAVLVLTPKTLHRTPPFTVLRHRFLQGEQLGGEKMRAAFGAVHTFTPYACHAFFISGFLCPLPQFASPRDF